jgi:hypothetical protein
VVVALLLSCGSAPAEDEVVPTPAPVESTVRIEVVPREGEPNPTGVARLSRRESGGGLDINGDPIPPEVTAADLGTIAFGEVIERVVPDGGRTYDVQGFDPSGRCITVTCPTGLPRAEGWVGYASVFVGAQEDYEQLPAADRVTFVASGTEGTLQIEVVESCDCPD